MPDGSINSGNWSYMEFLFDPKTSSQQIFSLGLIPGYAFNSGVIIMLILTIMVIGSMPFVRRGGCFEVRSTAISAIQTMFMQRLQSIKRVSKCHTIWLSFFHFRCFIGRIFYTTYSGCCL